MRHHSTTLNTNPRKQLERPALPHPRSAACYLPLKQISDRTLQPRFCVYRLPVGQTLSHLSFLAAPSTCSARRLTFTFHHPPTPFVFFAFSRRVANVLACDRNNKSPEIPTLAPPVREQKEGVGSCEQVGSEHSTKRSTLRLSVEATSTSPPKMAATATRASNNSPSTNSRMSSPKDSKKSTVGKIEG